MPRPGRVEDQPLEKERLHEDGVPVAPGSARWDVFWARWPEMAEAREHWLVWTRPLCTNR